MRAGRGIRHSQINLSAHEIDHHFQIWLAPRSRGLEPPGKTLRLAPHCRGIRVAIAPGRGTGGAAIEADADVLWGRAEAGVPLVLPARAGASRYLHLMSGALTVAGHALAAGNALAQREAGVPLTLHTDAAAEALCFELPAITR